MKADRLKFLCRCGWDYYANAKTCFDLDSPFIVHLTNTLFAKNNKNEVLEKIELRRKELLKDTSTFERKDYGQGSMAPGLKHSKIKVSSWVLNSSISPYFGNLLYRLVSYLQPISILELGAAAGLSGSYLAAGALGSFISIEGDPTAARIARKTYTELSLFNAVLIPGLFTEVLPKTLSSYSPDMIFIDGNHHGLALQQYIDCIYPKLRRGISTIIIDDIRWNEDMYRTWKLLAQDKRWQSSIDLLRIGILIKNPDILHHQAFTLIDYKYKPWRLGILR